MPPQLAPIITWRSAVASEHGPESPTTRLVLLTLSLHMNEKGGSCFPSIETLAVETGLGDKAVRVHLATAAQEGWITRHRHGYGDQRYWRYEYEATVPEKMRSLVPVVPAEDAVPESKTTGTSVQKMRSHVPLSSSKSSSSNSSENERAPANGLDGDKPLTHEPPAVALYRRETGLTPPLHFQVLIAERVGESQGALDVLRDVIAVWLATHNAGQAVRPYNLGNIPRLLAAFDEALKAAVPSKVDDFDPDRPPVGGTVRQHQDWLARRAALNASAGDA